LLRLFVSVVECGGFSAAQGELGLSQSSISQQMAKLETRLGYRLCSRGKGGFRSRPRANSCSRPQGFVRIHRSVPPSIQRRGRTIDRRGALGLSEAVDQSVLLRVADAIRRFVSATSRCASS
jgi:hypothetical protein